VDEDIIGTIIRDDESETLDSVEPDYFERRNISEKNVWRLKNTPINRVSHSFFVYSPLDSSRLDLIRHEKSCGGEGRTGGRDKGRDDSQQQNKKKFHHGEIFYILFMMIAGTCCVEVMGEKYLIFAFSAVRGGGGGGDGICLILATTRCAAM
jgi:hypothetical protein